jgi:hypothetical protein
MRFLYAFLLAAPILWAQDKSGMPDMPNMPGMQPGMSMPMAQFHTGLWTFTAHGTAFIADTQQTGPSGHDKLFSVNWLMAEASRPLASGTLRLRSMLSLEPATVTNGRYPELFQTGETWHNAPIIDGQHPHNLFMELALEYSHPLGDGTTLTLYAAPVGDPALGPVAYPHRISAAELPQATLAHHLEDSTHISDDVITAGIRHGILDLEASGFHGAEPGENRWIIGHGAIDSYSARLTVTPTTNWTAQISAGRLTHPEALEPGDQIRTTASTTYTLPHTRGNWATSLIWGRVHKTDDNANLNGYTLESVARFLDKNYLTGRIELVDKDELILPGNFRIAAYTGGYTRDLPLVPRIATGLGANITTYTMPDELHTVYGRRPVGIMLFLRLRLRLRES